MIDVGQAIGNYRITAKLGEGGMGVVFLAEHPVIGRRAALKAIHPEYASNTEVVTRFVNEARAISQIGHDHIVEVTDFGRGPQGDFYFIMEYLQGEPLADVIAREAPLAPERALAIAAQVADALGASHARGVVHRDLKPENVFLTARGRQRDFVKVVDFGIAELVSDVGARARRAAGGPVAGTPYYMSPEQCMGRPELDGRADVYALGVMLFEMLTGKLPFGGDTVTEILEKQVAMPPPAARSIVPSLPQSLDALLHRALAKDPAQRFQSMEEFRGALGAPAAGAVPHVVLEDLSGRVRAARPMARGDLARDAASSPPATRTTLQQSVGVIQAGSELDLVPRRTGRRAVLTALAVAGLAAVVVLGRAGGGAAGSDSSATSAARGPLPAAVATRAETVRVTFGSDPHGASVVGPDGRVLGATPLSIELASSDAAVEYTFTKPGYMAKKLSLIPNVSSPVFAVMQSERPVASTPVPRAPKPHAHKTATPAPAPAASGAVDDVLPPSYR
jgi:serine/threonine-protein kinase